MAYTNSSVQCLLESHRMYIHMIKHKHIKTLHAHTPFLTEINETNIINIPSVYWLSVEIKGFYLYLGKILYVTLLENL